MKKVVGHIYEKIISLENLLEAWDEFVEGKGNRVDVKEFASNLFANILDLHNDLSSSRYVHASYEKFNITDPKPRIIHKASVRDRLLHRAVYRIIYPFFDRNFIFDSYSSRKTKGTHRAFNRLVTFARKSSKNYHQPCWALKCDIRKYFHSVDHEVLIGFLSNRIGDVRACELLENIIHSFEMSYGKGMPLGNLTSQLFANIYIDPLDKFIKHKLKVEYYERYADDFLLIGSDANQLLGYFIEIYLFLKSVLKLDIHPEKNSLRKLNWGIDYVGYVAFPHHSLLRGSTKRRMFKRMNKNNLPSYLGLLEHCDGHKLSNQVKSLIKI